MPGRKRGWIDNACYHITHRCHERRFLFRFAKYRNFSLDNYFRLANTIKSISLTTWLQVIMFICWHTSNCSLPRSRYILYNVISSNENLGAIFHRKMLFYKILDLIHPSWNGRGQSTINNNRLA